MLKVVSWNSSGMSGWDVPLNETGGKASGRDVAVEGMWLIAR